MSQALLIDDQCAIPAFDRLFLNDKDNKNILGLLFLLSTWHAYAKLCLHTDTTLEMFESICTVLCQALRHFAAVTCPRYATKELPQEADAQARTAIRNKATNASTTTKTKKFNMTMFKLHCIPDYPLAIQQYCYVFVGLRTTSFHSVLSSPITIHSPLSYTDYIGLPLSFLLIPYHSYRQSSLALSSG